jgi:hypothetical protein
MAGITGLKRILNQSDAGFKFFERKWLQFSRKRGIGIAAYSLSDTSHDLCV